MGSFRQPLSNGLLVLHQPDLRSKRIIEDIFVYCLITTVLGRKKITTIVHVNYFDDFLEV